MIDTYQYYKSMDESNIMLLFKGAITEDLLSSILQIAESKLESINEQPKVKKRVFNVLVECLQNVYHHIDKESISTKESESAILMVGSSPEGYFVVTGNHVPLETAQSLDTRLAKLNKMSKDELRTLYREVLSNDGFSEKGGAGLGFIDILRKSGQPLDYNFIEVGDDLAFFTLKATISNAAVKS